MKEQNGSSGTAVLEEETEVPDARAEARVGRDRAAARRTKRPLLTAREVAERLQVNRATVYEWSAIGYLPSVCLSEGSRKRCVRFEEEAIEDWLKERERAGRVDRVRSLRKNGGAPVGHPKEGR